MSATAERRNTLAPLPVHELESLLVERNPAAPAAAKTAGQVTAVLGKAAMSLTHEQQKRLAKTSSDKIVKVFEALIGRSASPEAKAEGRTVLVGDGLGEQLSDQEGRRRLAAYATPMAIEEWAGPVAGATVLEQEQGISRSTLHAWRHQNAVIGLLKGTRHHVYPVAQFIDGRPVEGLGAILEQVRSPRVAWMWLIEPHPALKGETPLARLKAGDIATVIRLAERDYGQS